MSGRVLVVATVVMDLSDQLAEPLTEEVLRAIWFDKVDGESFLTDHDEVVLGVSLSKTPIVEIVRPK